MPFVAFMAKWLTTARGVRRTRPLSSISRRTTTLGNRYAPKKRVGSVTPAQDDGRETCHLGCCSITACGYLNRATRPTPGSVATRVAVRQRKGRSLLQAVKEKKGSSRCPGRRASNPGLNLSGALCKNPHYQGCCCRETKQAESRGRHCSTTHRAAHGIALEHCTNLRPIAIRCLPCRADH